MRNKEEQEAIIFANWLRSNWYTFTHIANESGLPPKVAMLSAIKKKKMWVSPWFPDFCIILKRGSILFIEMKRTLSGTDYRKDGKLLANAPHMSPEQQVWIDVLNGIDNVWAFLCYWLEECKKKVQEMELK